MTTAHLTIDPINNPEYVATIVRIADGDLYSVPGLDNLVGYSKFGMQALTDKVTTPGLYILFSTEVQLSQEFAAANNLFRDPMLNMDQTAKGYLETNRRVKAIKLKGNRSESLLMPITALEGGMFSPDQVAELREGDVFQSLNGIEICRKYVPRGAKQAQAVAAKARTRRVSAKVFPEHTDTSNYFRNSDTIPADAHVTITQKLHGTSVRFGNVPVTMPSKWWQRLLRRPQRNEHQFVVGSRRVVKSINLSTTEGKDHWYADGDLWTRFADHNKIADRIPKDHIVYGELVGWTGPGSPIQRDYTYGEPDGSARLYVYRVAVITTDGALVDMPHLQMQQWCNERGFATVPVLWSGPHHLFDANDWLEARFYDDWVHQALVAAAAPIPLSNNKLVDEGVCVRYDGPHGAYLLKAKSKAFLEHETKMLDAEAEDLEAIA